MEQLNVLKEQLLKGEELLWSGQPEGFETLDAEYKPGYVKRLVIIVLAVAAFCAGYLAVTLKNGTGIKPGIFVIVVGFAAFALINPFSDVKKLKNNYLYAVSNRRVFVITDKVKSAEIAEIPSVSVRRDSAGSVSFLFGEAAKTKKNSAIRALAVTCINKDGEDFAKNIVMYGVKDSEGLKKVLKQYMPVA